MAKAAKPKPIKNKTHSFYGLNIKIRSDHREGAEMYEEVFQRLYDSAGVVKISGSRGMAMPKLTKRDLDFNDQTYKAIYGTIVRFVILDDDKWYNDATKAIENNQIPNELHPGTTETEYVFIPEAHRFYFLSNSKITIGNMIEYLLKAIESITPEDEPCDISVLQETDVITRILSSDSIKSLKVHVSYTNDDIGDEYKELMDDMLKDTDSNTADFKFKSKPDKDLNKDSKMVKGLVELSQENGYSEATIIEGGKKNVVKTFDYPAKTKITIPENEGYLKSLFKSIMSKYRNGRAND